MACAGLPHHHRLHRAAHFATNWGHYLLLTWLPTYLTSLGLQLGAGGALFAMPYLVAVVMGNTGGWIADELLQRRCGWSLRTTRKAMQAIAHGVPAACFGLLCATTSAVAATAMLTVAISAASFSHSGYNANLIDICGGEAAHTARMMGVVNTVGTLPGILASWSTGQLLTGDGTQAEWRRVWTLGIAVYAVGLGAFLRFCQGHDVVRVLVTAEARAKAAATAGGAEDGRV